jgi:DNA-binding FrmR family transcriptional regulator
MELPDDVVIDVRKRLKRIEGQVRGIEKMLEDGRECRDIVTQLSAAKNALEQAGFRLISAGLTWCISNPDEATEGGYPVTEVERMFMKLT